MEVLTALALMLDRRGTWSDAVSAESGRSRRQRRRETIAVTGDNAGLWRQSVRTLNVTLQEFRQVVLGTSDNSGDPRLVVLGERLDQTPQR